MDEVCTLKTEREVIETTLRDPVADISELRNVRTLGPWPPFPPVPKFLQALKDLGDVDEEAISEAHFR